MGNLAWGQQRITRVEVEPLRSHLELELTFEEIESFLLVIMQVASRAPFGQEGVLQDEEIACVRRDHFGGFPHSIVLSYQAQLQRGNNFIVVNTVVVIKKMGWC